MNRKEFLVNMGKYCVGSCMCALAGGISTVHGQDTTKQAPQPSGKPRSQERIEFAEKWITRFMGVLDSTLDEGTRKKVMMANGKACFLAWIKDTGQEIKPMSLEKLAAWVKANVKDGSTRIEGNVIYFQYMAAAETGLPSEESACLCSLVESKPVGLSPTYCLCSLGYVKEWHEQLLGRPVEVELVSAVLKGGKRCQFKITVA